MILNVPYPGEHDAIVDLDTWQAVRTLLAQNAVGRTRKTNAGGSFLAYPVNAHDRYM